MNTIDIVTVSDKSGACVDRLNSVKKEELEPIDIHNEHSVIADAKAIKMTGEEQTVCVICIEEINGEQSPPCVKFNCGHELHVPCVVRYVIDKLAKNNDLICPVCRYNQCPHNTQTYATMRDHFGIAPPSERNSVYTVTGLELNDYVNATSLNIDRRVNTPVRRIPIVRTTLFTTVLSLIITALLMYAIFGIK